MSITQQEFLAHAAEKAAQDLETALLRIPEDKRAWQPMDKARSALDQYAECALLNGSTADIIINKTWPEDYDFVEYGRARDELMTDWNAMQSLLQANTGKVVAAIREVRDEDLRVKIQMPWGPMTLAQIIAYPYWNMSYHEGQINYIASMLGCLE